VQTLTARPARAADAATVPRLITYLGAAGFAVAAAWFWLATRGVTVATAPRTGPGMPPQQAMRIYYQWKITTLPQERYYTSIAIGGFLCLAITAVFLRNLLGHNRALPRAGALAIGAGSLLWITGSVAELGGHRAVGLMATHANPIQTTNSIAFTIDMIAAAFALAGFAMIGAGMLALAAAAALQRSRHRAWAAGTAVMALVILATAGSYGAGNDNLSDLMLFAVGVAVLPVWLIWTGRIGGTGDTFPDPSLRVPPSPRRA
jgi:hypothetical protein